MGWQFGLKMGQTYLEFPQEGAVVRWFTTTLNHRYTKYPPQVRSCTSCKLHTSKHLSKLQPIDTNDFYSPHVQSKKPPDIWGGLVTAQCQLPAALQGLMGLKNPMIVTFPLSYLAIAQSAMKMILVLCDPLRRIEKIFWYWTPGKFMVIFCSKFSCSWWTYPLVIFWVAMDNSPIFTG